MHGCPHVAVCLCPIHLICVPSTCMECAHASVHVFMPTWVLNSAPFPMHSNMETWMSLCGTVCFAVIPLLFPDLGENVYMHQYMYFSLPDSPCLLHSISILTWKDGYLCVALCVFQSLSPWFHILDRRCTCISTCTSVYLTPYVCFTLFAYLRGKMGSSVWQIVCLPVICFWSHTLFKMCTCISTLIYVLTWLHMSVPPHLYSFMKTWMPLCDIVVLCVFSSHSTSGNTPWFKCVHASVHVFMSIWLLVSPQTPMHSYTETRVALCGSVFVSHSPHFYSLNLYGMCTCISTCIYANQSSEFCSHPLCIVTWKHGYYCVALCVLQSSHFCSQTLVWMCTCISTYIYANLTSKFCSIPYPYSHGKMGSSV